MSELVVDAKNEQNEDFKLIIKSPTSQQLAQAKIVSGQAFKRAIQKDLMFREKLYDSMREQGLWDDTKEAELKSVTQQLADGERRLAKGAAPGFKKLDAKKLAVDMRRLRIKQAEL